jgi:hypothetical protein
LFIHIFIHLWEPPTVMIMPTSRKQHGNKSTHQASHRGSSFTSCTSLTSCRSSHQRIDWQYPSHTSLASCFGLHQRTNQQDPRCTSFACIYLTLVEVAVRPFSGPPNLIGYRMHCLPACLLICIFSEQTDIVIVVVSMSIDIPPHTFIHSFIHSFYSSCRSNTLL